MFSNLNIKNTIIYLILFIFLLITVTPIIWMISTSLKYNEDIYSSEIKLIPDRINLNNYSQLWEKAPFNRFLINSAIITLFVVVGRLLLCSLAAYAFAKVNFIGRDFWFLVVIGTLIVPLQVNIVSNYILLSGLNLVNTYAGIILPYYGFGVAFGIFLLRQHFLTIPEELRECAILDGCGHVRFFLYIVLPLSKAVISAYTIFSFMHAWNAYIWPLIITHSTEMRPIQVGLSLFKSQETGAVWGVIMAGSVIATLPTLIIFIFAQKQFINSLTRTGLKQ